MSINYFITLKHKTNTYMLTTNHTIQSFINLPKYFKLTHIQRDKDVICQSELGKKYRI